MDYGQAVWAECARTHNYNFSGAVSVPGGPAVVCTCHHCTMTPLPPPQPKKSFMDKLMGLIMCQCIFDPVPDVPADARLACTMDTAMPLAAGCTPCHSRPQSIHAGVGGCSTGVAGVAVGYLDPAVAKQHLKETVRLAKVNEKVYNKRLEALQKRSKKQKAEEERKKKAKAAADKAEKAKKEKEAKEKKEREDKAKREAAKFEAWARRNGCTTLPATAAQQQHQHLVPGCAPAVVGPCAGGSSTFFAVPRPTEYAVRRDPFTDAWGNQWPLMSNAMIHAVRQQNREDMLLGIANGNIHCR